MHTDGQIERDVTGVKLQLPVMLEAERIVKLRAMLHELANLFTGVLMGGGVLCRALEGDKREAYAEALCELGERGAVVIREAREILIKSDQKSEMLGGRRLQGERAMSAEGEE